MMFIAWGMLGYGPAEAREKIKPLPFTHDIPPTYLNFQGKALGVLSSPEQSVLEKHICRKNVQPNFYLETPAQCLIFFTKPESALAQKCWVTSTKDSNSKKSEATQVRFSQSPPPEKGLGYLYLPEISALERSAVDSNSKVSQSLKTDNKLNVVSVPSLEKVRTVNILKTALKPVVSPNNKWMIIVGENSQAPEVQIFSLVSGVPIEWIQAKLVGMPPCPWKNSKLCGVSQVQWSPKGEMLGFVLHHQWVGFAKWDENLFYQGFLKPSSESNLVDIEKNSLKVGNFITNARWTPNGKHFLLLNAPQKIPTPHRLKGIPGELISVEVQSEGGIPLRVVSRTALGLNPFGLDINPKGTLVVAVNTEHTDCVNRFPLRFLNKRNFSSLSLVSVEPELGTLKTLSPPLYFRGALSKSVVFDNLGEMIAVSVPQDSDWDLRDKNLNYGWVEFFQVHQTPSNLPQLLPTHIRLKVPQGANDLVIFR